MGKRDPLGNGEKIDQQEENSHAQAAAEFAPVGPACALGALRREVAPFSLGGDEGCVRIGMAKSIRDAEATVLMTGDEQVVGFSRGKELWTI